MSKWDPKEPIRLTGIDVPPAPQEPKRAAPWLVITLVIVLLVAGFGAGWAVVQLRQGAGSPAEPSTSGEARPSSTPTRPATVTVPFDLTAGLDTPDGVGLVATSEGVAVFQIASGVRRNLGDAEVGFAGFGLGRYLLRGVEIATGRVLWTYDQLPGLVVLVDFLESEGKIAVSAMEARDGDGPLGVSCARTLVVVLSMRTGEVVGSGAGPIAADCLETEYGFYGGNYYPKAYQDGILVLERHYARSDDAGETVAYLDTDLAHPLWRETGEGGSGSAGWVYSDTVLPGGWVKAKSGVYVSMSDGSHSLLTSAAKGHDDLRYEDREFAGVDGKIMELVGTPSQSSAGGLPDVTWRAVKRMDDPKSGTILWQREILAGQSVGSRPCVAGSPGFWLLRSDVPEETGGPGRSAMRALNPSTGDVIWSTPIPGVDFGMRGISCVVVAANGDQRAVAVVDPAGFTMIDVMTGVVLGRWDSPAGAQIFLVTAVFSCGPTLACVYEGNGTYGDKTQEGVTWLFDYSSPQIKVVESRSATWIGDPFMTESGPCVVTTNHSGGYEFVIL